MESGEWRETTVMNCEGDTCRCLCGGGVVGRVPGEVDGGGVSCLS